jgi:hypothetical protein
MTPLPITDYTDETDETDYTDLMKSYPPSEKDVEQLKADDSPNFVLMSISNPILKLFLCY